MKLHYSPYLKFWELITPSPPQKKKHTHTHTHTPHTQISDVYSSTNWLLFTGGQKSILNWPPFTGGQNSIFSTIK